MEELKFEIAQMKASIEKLGTDAVERGANVNRNVILLAVFGIFPALICAVVDFASAIHHW